MNYHKKISPHSTNNIDYIHKKLFLLQKKTLGQKPQDLIIFKKYFNSLTGY